MLDPKKIIELCREDKKAKTINFDSIVLKRLEEIAKKEGITTSKFVNEIVKRAVMDDNEFYGEMAKIHCALMNHYRTLGGGK